MNVDKSLIIVVAVLIKNKAKSYQHYQQPIIISMLVLIKKIFFQKQHI